ncbi:unnamed protein product [marine sediment metagenome]|uniref:Uncharacterized protein n=1 Tax=marine sediment metagenome TaxID=412755 RepID=X1FLM4_9ZZZZ
MTLADVHFDIEHMLLDAFKSGAKALTLFEVYIEKIASEEPYPDFPEPENAMADELDLYIAALGRAMGHAKMEAESLRNGTHQRIYRTI